MTCDRKTLTQFLVTEAKFRDMTFIQFWPQHGSHYLYIDVTLDTINKIVHYFSRESQCSDYYCFSLSRHSPQSVNLDRQLFVFGQFITIIIISCLSIMSPNSTASLFFLGFYRAQRISL